MSALKGLRPQIRLLAAFVCGVAVSILLGSFAQQMYRYVILQPSDMTSGSDLPDQAEVSALSFSRPTQLIIPAIDLAVPFGEPLGLNPDQTIMVPDSYESVGWYQYGPTPGELGPAVVLGHVDSYEGPAVFYNLRQLTPGDEVLITRADGETVTFIVTDIKEYAQSQFPSAMVYGDTDHAALRLVTCSGLYNHHTARYSHNTVVFAELASA